MNGPMVRALLQDALYQVFDNKIFRLLMLLVIAFVAPTFLIGFRKDEVLVLWGWQRLTYEQIFSWLGQSTSSFKDVQGGAIQVYQELVVDGLCGNLGMVFCVAATAFFVPRMLEKGSADVLLSKPLSRTMLLLARYVSGLLFVAILAFALVIGMYFGFLIVSGYNDLGFLWGAFTLVYLFAIIHAVSTLAGVLTRSTVASTLIAIACFMGTGCVHQIWRVRAFFHDSNEAQKLRTALDADKGSDAELPAILDEEPGTFTKLALLTLDTVHYTLPKTSDADLITRKLRRAIERSDLEIEDETARLVISEPPEGFELVVSGLPEPSKGRIIVDLAQAPVVWRLAGNGLDETARIEVTRRSRFVERPANAESGARQRPRKLTAAAAADEWIDRAKKDGVLDSEPSERTFAVDGVPTAVVGWYEKTATGRKVREVAVLSAGDWLVEVSETADPGWSTPSERSEHFDRFLNGSSSESGFQIARKVEFEDPDAWYERRFASDAPLPYNLWFSIGSSIAFSLAMLVLASWKLSRIDF
ncbi:MAG: ABC transporter permease [Planctomycetota bacterium]